MNLLLIQLRRIGDVMMTTPAIRALRKSFPDAIISFLTETPSHQVYKYNPHLDHLLVYPKKNRFGNFKNSTAGFAIKIMTASLIFKEIPEPHY